MKKNILKLFSLLLLLSFTSCSSSDKSSSPEFSIHGNWEVTKMLIENTDGGEKLDVTSELGFTESYQFSSEDTLIVEQDGKQKMESPYELRGNTILLDSKARSQLAGTTVLDDPTFTVIDNNNITIKLSTYNSEYGSITAVRYLKRK